MGRHIKREFHNRDLRTKLLNKCTKFMKWFALEIEQRKIQRDEYPDLKDYYKVLGLDFKFIGVMARGSLEVDSYRLHMNYNGTLIVLDAETPWEVFDMACELKLSGNNLQKWYNENIRFKAVELE